MKPLIYISYGMAKSGSTLAYRLARAVAGVDGPDDYAQVIRPKELAALRARAETTGAPVLVKTHGGLWNCVAEGLAEGWIIGHATCRDPRDITLSMLDAGARGDDWGRATVDAALETIRAHVEKFERWATAPGMVALAYEPLAFDTADAAKTIARQLGRRATARVATTAADVAHAGGTNRNKALPRRHEAEMDPLIAARIGTEFAGFIERWCAPGFAAPKRGGLRRWFAR